MDSLFAAEKLNACEALLFSASEPVSVQELAKCLECSEADTKELINMLAEHYENRGFRLKEIAGGWQFMTGEEMYPYLQRLYEPKVKRLSKAAMETLAIIAYLQPVTRGQIEEIRGVNADTIVSRLLEKGFLEEKGRRDTPGKPVLYGTGRQFLELMGINSLEDLPVPEGSELS